MKVLITGAAGQMAQPAINYLSSLSAIDKITLADLSEQKLKTIIEKNGSPKCYPLQLDIRDSQRLSDALTGQDVVLNLVGPYYHFGTTVLEAAIQNGVNYVDIADDFDTTAQLLELNDKAAQAGITALIGMGASPGMINVVARLSSDHMDQIEEINTSWVVGETNSDYTGAVVHLFHVMGNEIPTFENGQMKYIMPGMKEGARVIDFPPPIGPFEVYHIGHPEPVTLSKFIPGVQTVTNRGAIYPAERNFMFKVLVEAGFTSERPIPFRGEMVAPLEFFEALFRAAKEVMPPETEPSKMAMAVEVKGKKENSELVHCYYLADFGEMEAFTGFPAAIGVEMLLAGEAAQKGVIAPECLNPVQVLHRLSQATDAFNKLTISEKVNGTVKREGLLFDQNIWLDLWGKAK